MSGQRLADTAHGRQVVNVPLSQGRPAPGQMPTDDDGRCTQVEGMYQCRGKHTKDSPFCIGHKRQAIRQETWIPEEGVN